MSRGTANPTKREDWDQPAHPRGMIRVFAGNFVGSHGSKAPWDGERKCRLPCTSVQSDLSIRRAHMPSCRKWCAPTRSGAFRPRVVSAQNHFGTEMFRPVSFRQILVGHFGLIFLSPPRLRIIGRTIIWLFDEESSDAKGLFFFKVPPG